MINQSSIYFEPEPLEETQTGREMSEQWLWRGIIAGILLASVIWVIVFKFIIN